MEKKMEVPATRPAQSEPGDEVARGELGAGGARQHQARDRRVSWDTDPDVIDLRWPTTAGAGVHYEWQVPTVAYLHLAVLFGSVCMTSDVLSLGYLALFLVGCATLTERAVWRKRSAAWEGFWKAWPFGGARGGGVLLNVYVVVVACLSFAAFAFHAQLIFARTPQVIIPHPLTGAPGCWWVASSADVGTGATQGPDDARELTSKEGRIFLALISMGLDAMAVCTAAAIATTDKLVEQDRTAVSVHDLGMVRHIFAVLSVSLNPCGLTAIYLLYAVAHLWRWTLQGGARSRSRAHGAVGAWSHILVGYYAAVHLFALYLFGAQLEGVSVSLTCPLARTLGLAPLDAWSWAAWASGASVLFLFLSSFSKVCWVLAGGLHTICRRHPCML